MSRERPSLEHRESEAEGRGRLLKTLMRIQRELRTSLLDELLDAEEMIEQGLFDVSSYSDQYEHYKYRFLDRLDTLRRLIHELNVLDKSRREHKSELLVAATLPELNARLQRRLRGLDSASSIVALEIEKAPPPKRKVPPRVEAPVPADQGSDADFAPRDGRESEEAAPMTPAEASHADGPRADGAAAHGVSSSDRRAAATETARSVNPGLPDEVWYALIVTASWRAIED